MTLLTGLRIVPVDLYDAIQAAAWLALLEHYARDPMGGGVGLSESVRANLVPTLADLSTFHAALAFDGLQAVGLINCFTGFSTFAAKPLLNVHDLVVHADARGQGVGQALLQWAEQRARTLGCCKLTLEVLSNNARALTAYERAGFEPYALDPAAGDARLMQKYLPEESA